MNVYVQHNEMERVLALRRQIETLDLDHLQNEKTYSILMIRHEGVWPRPGGPPPDQRNGDIHPSRRTSIGDDRHAGGGRVPHNGGVLERGSDEGAVDLEKRCRISAVLNRGASTEEVELLPSCG